VAWGDHFQRVCGVDREGVISKRFVKQQQMRWTKQGVHLRLQVRTQMLHDDLRETFCGWYAGMTSATSAEQRCQALVA
jgi:hypothetical protein